MSIWQELQRTPIAEVRRRAAIVEEWNGFEHAEIPGATRFTWNDGGGQAAAWFFADDGTVLLLTHDHESPLNFHDDYAGQLRAFDGVPAALITMVHNRPATDEFLDIDDEPTKRSLPMVGGIFWFDGTQWHVAEGLARHCAAEEIDLFDDSGLEYCTGNYLFGRDFTPENLITEEVANGFYEEDGEQEAALARLRTIFAAHDGGNR